MVGMIVVAPNPAGDCWLGTPTGEGRVRHGCNCRQPDENNQSELGSLMPKCHRDASFVNDPSARLMVRLELEPDRSRLSRQRLRRDGLVVFPEQVVRLTSA